MAEYLPRCEDSENHYSPRFQRIIVLVYTNEVTSKVPLKKLKNISSFSIYCCSTDARRNLRAKANTTVQDNTATRLQGLQTVRDNTATRLQTETHEQRLNRLQTVLDFLCVFGAGNVLYFPKCLRRPHFASVLQGHYLFPRKWVMFNSPR